LSFSRKNENSFALIIIGLTMTQKVQFFFCVLSSAPRGLSE